MAEVEVVISDVDIDTEEDVDDFDTLPDPAREPEPEPGPEDPVVKTHLYQRVRDIMVSPPYRLLVGRNLVLFLNLVYGIRGAPPSKKPPAQWKKWRKNLETQFLYNVLQVGDTTTKGSLLDLAMLLVLKANAPPMDVHRILGAAVLSGFPQGALEGDLTTENAWMQAKCVWS